jgi:hypothetical protein
MRAMHGMAPAALYSKDDLPEISSKINNPKKSAKNPWLLQQLIETPHLKQFSIYHDQRVTQRVEIPTKKNGSHDFGGISWPKFVA